MTLEPFIDDPDVKLYVGDVRDVLAQLPDESVDCCVTSPPYFGLRDYGTGEWEGGDAGCDHVARAGRSSRPAGGLEGGTATVEAGTVYRIYCGRCGARRRDRQIGLEATIGEYVGELVAVFRDVRRVLAPHGTCWLNLGDSYANDGKWGGSSGGKHADALHGDTGVGRQKNATGLKPKDLCGVPWRVALALQADGWHLRSEIIWWKRNAMPESVNDRPTKAHEQVFLLTKRSRYYYDPEPVREPFAEASAERYRYGFGGEKNEALAGTLIRGAAGSRTRMVGSRSIDDEPPEEQEPLPGMTGEAPRGPDGRRQTHVEGRDGSIQHRSGDRWPTPTGRNMRSVWDIATKPYAEAHFAVFPEELPRRAIAAGCPERVCRQCGKPSERITKTTAIAGVTRKKPLVPEVTEAGDGRNGRDSDTFGNLAAVETVGWTTCGCAHGLLEDDLEVIDSPIGADGDRQDTTMTTGRKGLGRTRLAGEGTRPMTRYEQRQYAGQIHASEHRAEMEAETTAEAVAHYARTDASGARPVPPDTLERWIDRGWLTRAELPPELGAGDYRPGVVLDPFSGAGTTALVARKLNRHAIGIELNPEYAALQARRIAQQSLFAE